MGWMADQASKPHAAASPPRPAKLRLRPATFRFPAARLRQVFSLWRSPSATCSPISTTPRPASARLRSLSATLRRQTAVLRIASATLFSPLATLQNPSATPRTTTSPTRTKNRLDWLKNLKAEITTHAATLHWDAAKLATVSALLDPLIAGYQSAVDTDRAAVEANATAAQLFAQQNDSLRALVNEANANPDFTDGMAATMKVLTGRKTVDPAALKPTLRAEAHPGSVRLSGSKDYAELIDIYMRVAGATAWTLVGIRRKKLPFDDQTPLKTPGVPETREYMARAVIDDQEVGQPSDIVTVTFAG